MSRYEPNVTEGVAPSDGGWTSDDGQPVLLLMIPEFTDVINRPFEQFAYAWMFNAELDAYIFCFQLDDVEERAIVFHAEHAGILLTEATAYDPFHIVITDQAFEQISEETKLLHLPNIAIKRVLAAGW